ncbi:MAG TPA: iron ABC transporter permease, partial [Acidimicrobiia bacterium]|nr:iron ABC transporter permease [Acidimicrobiia bacterium]
MAALAPPVAPTAVEPSPRQGRRAPAVLWVLGVLVVVPALVPIGFLVWSVIRPGGIDAGGIAPGRLAELLGSTALLVASVTVTALVVGTTTAWLTTRTDLRGSRTWSTLVSLPLVIPSYVGALAMLGSSGNAGLISEALRAVGLSALPVFSGFWAAWAALSLWNFSYVHLLAVPALRRMDPALEEAARGLGASRWRTVTTVVVPQLRPALLGASLLVGLYVLSDFGAVSVLRYETFTRAIYTQFRGRLDPTPALFLSGILVIIALLLVFAQQRARGRASLHSDRPPRRAAVTTLAGWRRLSAYGFLTTVVGGALVLPLLTLGWWAVRGAALGNEAGTVGTELIRSASVSLVAAVVTVTAAVPLAILTVRYRNRRTAALESAAWATYSLPHLAVGLGFLVLAVRVAPGIYQTLVLLVIAYVAMFMSQAMTAIQSGLSQVGPNLEAASRSLGMGQLATLRRITLPLVRHSMVAGGGLVFLT